MSCQRINVWSKPPNFSYIPLPSLLPAVTFSMVVVGIITWSTIICISSGFRFCWNPFSPQQMSPIKVRKISFVRFSVEIIHNITFTTSMLLKIECQQSIISIEKISNKEEIDVLNYFTYYVNSIKICDFF